MSDPYSSTATAKSTSSPQEKINGLHPIIKAAGSAMLTTRGKDGFLHSRAMAPASYESLHFDFLANNTSGKFDELEQDSHVNVSFYDPSSTGWISVAGTAKLSSNRELIKKLWSPATKAWFGDLGDGVHTGDANDPRVSVIEVIPEEIKYWYATRTKLGQLAEVATSAITGNVASPGELRTITKEEIALVEGLNTKV